jgi:thioredoxin-related protein
VPALPSASTANLNARDNFVLVELDYPRARVQAPEVVQQNQTLAHRFRIEVFPTVIILNSDGKKIGELIGFDPHAGPEGYIASLEKFRKG